MKVEAHYDVGEYNIAILSAKEGAGAGLMTWLNKFHYEVPPAAVPVLDSYIKQGMRFFVAKVNFRKVRGQPTTFLRPIQVRYSTPKFMLPVRLGTINADGPQELVVYALSAHGRVEATNYRTVRAPTGGDLPLYVKDQFEKVYASIFETMTAKEDMRAIFVEYVQKSVLDRGTADHVGIAWVYPNPERFVHYTLTRLHFRYDRDHFPEDLVLQETFDTEPFAMSFNVYHNATRVDCGAGEAYQKQLPARRTREAETLAALTSWDVGEIREKMGLSRAPEPEKKEEGFWQRLWR